MIVSASVLFFGYALAQQNWVHQTPNISKWSSPSETSLPSLRVIINVFLDENFQPAILTLSDLPKATALEESRSIPSAATSGSRNNSSLSTLHSPLNSSFSPLFQPCSVSDAATCNSSRLSSKSTSPATTSQAKVIEFTSSAKLFKLDSVYCILFLATCSQLLRIVIDIA